LQDRVAGLLVLLYAQPVSSISRTTIDQIDTTTKGTTLALGRTPIRLPEPLDHLVTDLAEQRRGFALLNRDRPSHWLFPGGIPGQPLSAQQLGHRLRRTLGIRLLGGRTAALLDLSTQLPTSLISRLLGISERTATRWAESNFSADYAAEVSRRSP
jgi:hypothetical protein